MKFAPFRNRSQGPRRAAARAFTLVETMVATVLLSMIIISILAVLIGSYRVAAKARYNDHARYVVKSLADQFLTQQTVDGLGNTLALFNITNATGAGMGWTNSDGSLGIQTGQGLMVLLGDNTGAPVQAYVTRTVYALYAGDPRTGNSGQPALNLQNGAPGYMLRGDFTITYSFLGVQMLPMTVSVVRSVP